MTVLPVILWPESWLTQPSVPVLPEEFGTETLNALVQDMLDTVRELGGLGIAAPQVGVHKQVIVVWNPDGVLQALCNPSLAVLEPECVQATEGCLSLPGVMLPTNRAKTVEVVAKAPDGSDLAFKAEGRTAVAVQHEVDHLLGKTIADGVGKMKANLLKAKMKKAMRSMERNVKAQREQYQELHSVRKEIRAKAPSVEHAASDYTAPTAAKPVEATAEAPKSDHVVASP